MYDNGYEEYMRSVLGYQNSPQSYNTYGNFYEDVNGYFPYRSGVTNSSDERNFEDRYPDIYRIVKPMVKKACGNNFIDKVSSSEIDFMVDDIYRNVYSEDVVVNVNVTADATVDQSRANIKTKEVKDDEKRGCQNCQGNPLLRDLIKILVLNQLINNRPPRPGRPPMPPPRPPYGQMPRPPFRSEYMDNSDFNDNQNFPY